MQQTENQVRLASPNTVGSEAQCNSDPVEPADRQLQPNSSSTVPFCSTASVEPTDCQLQLDSPSTVLFCSTTPIETTDCQLQLDVVIPLDSTIPSVFTSSSLASTPESEVLAIIRHISPLPKSKVMRKRKRQIDGAEVVTSTPTKMRLMEKATKKGAQSSVMDRPKEKARKKLMCRLDKKRGLKPASKKTQTLDRPSAAAKIQLKTGGKKARKSERNGVKNAGRAATNDKEVPCLYCGEKFSDSRKGEEWIQCVVCQGWCHVDCTSGETSRGFTCDFCYED